MPYIKKFNIDRTQPLESQLEDIKSFMRRSCKLRRIHKAIIDALDVEFLKAYKTKYRIELKLIEVKKIPTPKKGTRRNNVSSLPQSGRDIYKQMTPEQKEEFRRELLSAK